MRFVAIPILILLVMSQAFSNWIVVMSFNLNRDYIAKNLCVNRYRPTLNCNGKCVLMQRMKEKEKEEQNQPSPRLDMPVIVLSSKTFFANTISPATVSLIASETDSRFAKPVDRSLPFFQPPRA